MELKELASVSGKGVLFKVIATTKSGLILESLDEAKTKFVASTNQKISILNEISIYTKSSGGSLPLHDVLITLKDKFGDELGVDPGSETDDLKGFMKSVLPDYDEARVYASDIRKLIRWYGAIKKFAPEILENRPVKEETKEDAPK